MSRRRAAGASKDRELQPLSTCNRGDSRSSRSRLTAAQDGTSAGLRRRNPSICCAIGYVHLPTRRPATLSLVEDKRASRRRPPAPLSRLAALDPTGRDPHHCLSRSGVLPAFLARASWPGACWRIWMCRTISAGSGQDAAGASATSFAGIATTNNGTGGTRVGGACGSTAPCPRVASASRRGSPTAKKNERDAATGKASVDRVRSTLARFDELKHLEIPTGIALRPVRASRDAARGGIR